jgi:hypothetical protein
MLNSPGASPIPTNGVGLGVALGLGLGLGVGVGLAFGLEVGIGMLLAPVNAESAVEDSTMSGGNSR